MISENPTYMPIGWQLDTALAGAIPQANRIELTLLMLAWGRLSATEAIPTELRLGDDLLNDPKQIEALLIRLSAFGDDNFRVFAEVPRLVGGNYGAVLPAFRTVLDFMKAGL